MKHFEDPIDGTEKDLKAIEEIGKKFDTGKARWDLLPWKPIEQIVKVLTHGSEKYGSYNWTKVTPFRERYFAALIRHLVAWREGEKIDPDSHLSHLAHAACNIVFLMWGEINQEKE